MLNSEVSLNGVRWSSGGGWHSSMLLEGAAGEVAGFEAEWMEELCGKSDCLMLSSAPVDMDDVEEIQKKMAS